MSAMRTLDARAVADGLRVVDAVDALEAALRAGFDPEGDPPRTSVAAGAGELLVMPSAAAGHLACKLVTVGGDPRVQGTCVVFDPATLAPTALVDGAALTLLRTPAVSALAARHLAPAGARRLLVLGRGPQADAHVAALRAVLPELDHADVLGRDRGPGFEALVRAADVVVCATTARHPLFDGALVADDALVIAMGAHDPGARETDDALAARATVVVEARGAALREAGDVLLPLAAGRLREGELRTLAGVVAGTARVPRGAPRLFVSVGMAWEDAVVAGTLVARTARA